MAESQSADRIFKKDDVEKNFQIIRGLPWKSALKILQLKTNTSKEISNYLGQETEINLSHFYAITDNVQKYCDRFFLITEYR